MSRRAIAAIAFAALALWAGMTLARLRRAEVVHAAAVAAAAMPTLAAVNGQALIAADSDAARRALAQRIGDAGAAAGIRLSLAPLADTLDGTVALRVFARGAETGLLRFSSAVEQSPELIRWTRWTILPDGDGGLRLSTDAFAPWRAAKVAPASAGPVVALAAPLRSPPPARILFAPSPITADSAVPSGAPQLIGIVGRLPDDGVALLRLSDGSTRGLRRGETVEGWTVAAIAADRVRLTHDGRDHVEILPPAS